MTNFNNDLYKKKYLKYKIKYIELKKQFGGTLPSSESQEEFQKRIKAAVMPLSLATAETPEIWSENFAKWTRQRKKEINRELDQSAAQMTDIKLQKKFYALISKHLNYKLDYGYCYDYSVESFHTDIHAAEEAKKKAEKYDEIHCSYEPDSNSDFEIYTVPQLPYEATTAVYATIHTGILTMQFYKSKEQVQKAISMVKHFTKVTSNHDGNSDMLPLLKKSGIV
jgi:hypothetical protein